MKYNKGMTLIEVLIASIILFIAISAFSFVSRSTSLHEKRLLNAIDRALLAEEIKDTVGYYFQYEDAASGEYEFNDHKYKWQVEVEGSKAPLRQISQESSGNVDSDNGLIVLYKVTVTAANNDDKKILSFKDVYWKD